MAYADQEMSGNRVVALVIVAIVHILIGYALITGLAYEAVTQVVERVTTVDIEEPPPPEPEEEPPPPPPRFPPKNPSPDNNPGTWVTTSDYRSSWINREYTGTASFTLRVNTDGRVESCSITGGSAPSELKEATCRLIERRARFEPATDGNGNEVPGTYSSTVRWQIPN